MQRFAVPAVLTVAIAAFPAGESWAQSETGLSASSVIEEIVVTVERRAQSLQDYAGTAQAFSAADLARDGIGSEFRNLSFSVPGLNVSNQEGNLEIFLRGVGSSNNTELGDPAVASHINGVYIPRPRGLGAQFYDIERVEINKGPQGTLRGRNAVAGSVNIVTARPNPSAVEGYMQAEFGNFNQRSYQAALNLPLGEDLAVRLAGFGEQHDAYFNNVGVNQNLEAAGAEDELAGRLSVLYEPNDRLSVFAVADMVNEQGTGYPGAQMFDAFADEGFTFDDLEPRDIVYRGTQGELDSETWGIAATITYDFGPLIVEYTGSYRELDFNQTNASNEQVDFPGRDVSIDGVDYDNYSTVYWQQESESLINELRVYSPDDARLRWTAGIFSLDEDQTSGFFSLNDKGVFFSGVEFTMPEVEAESTAGYIDATFDLTDLVRIKAGVRYTDESKFRRGIGGNWTLGLGSDDDGCCFSTRLGTEGFIPRFQSRPTFVAPTTNAEIAQFLLDGAVSFGARDTLAAQIDGVIDGSMPNGTCVDRFDTNGGGSQVCPPDGEHSFLVLGAPGAQIGESSFDYWNWRVGIEFDLWSDTLVYASVSTGTKAGGFNDNIDVNLAPEFDPEDLTAYEIGTKNIVQVGNTPVVLNASAFFYDYQDQVFQTLAQTAQVGGDTGFSLLNQNVADSEILGLEIESAVELPAEFSLGANLLLMNAEIQSGELADVRGQDFGVDPTVGNIDLSGNDLPLASDVNLVLKLSQDLDLFGGYADWQVLANYRSSYHQSPFNDDDIVRPEGSTICGSNDAIVCGFEEEQDGFWTVNLNAGLSYDLWRLELFATNVFDEVASQKTLLGNNLNLRFLNLPRTYGIRLRFDLE